MTCAQCVGIEQEFNKKLAAKELRRYRRRGSPGTTRLLLDALKEAGVKEMSVLDIGGGIGAIPHDLLAAGAGSATDVDGASAYLDAAREEAQRLGHLDRMTFLHGDFVALATAIPPADIVTLDRVICCYHDMASLVQQSARRARRLYGVIYPRDLWWIKGAFRLFNLYLGMRGSMFRVFVHSTAEINTVIRAEGLSSLFRRNSGLWKISLYQRKSETAVSLGQR